jgi:uncharacterized RDD family membrane protein YckC
MAYYLHVSGARKGPVEINEIQRMIETDKLSLLDQIWDESAKKWTVIRDFPAIAKLFEKPDEYIINVDGKTGGPFPINMILREIEKGRFLGEHFVWNEKATRWVEAKSHPVFGKYFRRIPEPSVLYNLARGGVRIGPIPFTEVERLVRVGELKGDDYVWDFAKNRWVTLTEKPDLARLFTVTEEPVPREAVPEKTAAGPPVGTIPTGPKPVPREPDVFAASPTAAPPISEPPAAIVTEGKPARVVKTTEPEITERPLTGVEPDRTEPTVVGEETGAFEPTRPSPVKRIVGQIIDLAFISVSFLAVLIVMAVSGMNPLAPSPAQETYRATTFIAFGAIAVIYFLLRDGFGGASIGKRIMGLKVVQGHNARPANALHSIVRNLFLLVPILNIVEFAMIINDREGRRLGDKAVGCAEMSSTEAEYVRDHGLETNY